MRKIGITALAALYAVLILSVSVARTTAWASQQSEALDHSRGAEGSLRIGHLEKSDPPPLQKKWVESEFAVELPQETALGPIPSSSCTLLSIPEYRAISGAQRFSSRAPPSLS